MTKIDVFSGFLGAGKTTLIKKLIKEGYAGEKLVLIENEFGEIGIDGGFLKDAGIEITEMNSGCICCSLVGDFGKALVKVLDEFNPDRIFIEPSGVGKLSDVMRAIKDACGERAEIGSLVTVVDANKCRIYIRNFGEFFLDQLENAGTVVLSRTDGLDQSKLDRCVELIREHNEGATIVTTPWDQLTGKQLREAIENINTLASALEKFEQEHHHHGEHCSCGCHDHHHDDDCDCEECHGHHDHHEHEHHDHDHDHEHEHEHEHELHHDYDCDCEECSSHHHHNYQDPSVHAQHEHSHEHTEACHEHHTHAHDDHHHADEVFTSCGIETSRRYTFEELDEILAFFDEAAYGIVLRAKGIVAAADGSWFHFDYVPGERNIRRGSPEVTGRICVIGSGIDRNSVKEIFLA
ncbi:MAG: GTP-binding protein [Clostridia bacterium]|nr:GTP-binding protein [Clostridia bacterium]